MRLLNTASSEAQLGHLISFLGKGCFTIIQHHSPRKGNILPHNNNQMQLIVRLGPTNG